MKTKNKFLQAIFLGMIIVGSAQAADPTFTLTNNSGVYLYQDGGSEIAPGDTSPALIPNWPNTVAFNVKATRNGAYLGYMTVNFATRICAIGGRPYMCALDAANKLTLNYNSLTQYYTSGPNMGKPVTLPKISNYISGPQFRGVNIAGLEGAGTFGNAMAQQPDLPDARYFAEQGMNTVRLPIRWEYIVTSADAHAPSIAESYSPDSTVMNQIYLGAIKDTTQKYLQSGLNVVLDLHNYMRFCKTGAKYPNNEPNPDPVVADCTVATPQQLASIWNILSREFAPLAKQYPKQLIFELMNEPFSANDQKLNTNDVLTIQAAAVKVIRANGLDNLILLSGNYWDGLHGWADKNPDPDHTPSNGSVFTLDNMKANGITGDIGFDMHQYFDQYWSGTNATCRTFTPDTFKSLLDLDNLTAWMKANNAKVFLGEFGGSDTAECQIAITYMLNYLNANAYTTENGYGFIGWTAWRANRHGSIVSGFNFLQQADNTVYGNDPILQGSANGLMSNPLANYLVKPQN